MPSFRHRLTRSQQRQYDRSNEIATIPVRVSPRLRAAVALLEAALEAGDRARTEHLAQALCDEICGGLRVPPVRVVVGTRRPADTRGELHGLYTPAGGGRRDRIEVWMITAKRHQVVAYKTFLRTLLHEICHHLDYSRLALRESFHTDGFFKRESSLYYQVTRREETGVRSQNPEDRRQNPEDRIQKRSRAEASES